MSDTFADVFDLAGVIEQEWNQTAYDSNDIDKTAELRSIEKEMLEFLIVRITFWHLM